MGDAHLFQRDTKAAWKRRALQAEAELETIKRMRDLEFDISKPLIQKVAAYGLALKEINEISAQALLYAKALEELEP